MNVFDARKLNVRQKNAKNTWNPTRCGQIGTRRPAFWKIWKKSGQAVPIWPQGMIKLVTKSWGVKSGRAVPLIIGLMHIRVYKIQSLGVKSGRSVQLVGQRVQFWPQRVGFVSGTVCPVLTPSVQKIFDPSVLKVPEGPFTFRWFKVFTTFWLETYFYFINVENFNLKH